MVYYKGGKEEKNLFYLLSLYLQNGFVLYFVLFESHFFTSLNKYEPVSHAHFY